MAIRDDVAGLRREYADRGLTEADLAADPMTMFAPWFDEAREAGLYEPNAMVVSTVSADGQPSSRMVLLKGFSDAGFVFFTNLRSRKGDELAAEPRCALLFPWHPLERQVRVEGTATVLPRRRRDGVLRLAAARVPPRRPRLAPVAGRGVARGARRGVRRGRGGASRTTYRCPTEWGGYRVRPEVVEFWQGRPGRMHDRLVYRRDGPDLEAWRTERLAP